MINIILSTINNYPINNNRKIEDIKKNVSNNLVLVLLINKPINKESPIDDKLWDKGITIAQ